MKLAIRHHQRVIRGDLTWPRQTADRRAPWPAVILVHGRGSDSTTLVGVDFLRRKLLAAGMAVMRIDLFGHGRSDGDFADVTITRAGQDVKAAVDWLARHPRINPLMIGAIGHSMGGTAILLARNAGAELKTMVLLAPVGDTKYHAQWEYSPAMLRAWRSEGLLVWENRRGDVLGLHYGFYRDLASLDTLAMTKTNHQPILIIHGQRDRSVPLIESQRLYRVLDEPKQLVVLPQADHNFTRPADLKKVIGTTVDWLKRYHASRVARSVVIVVKSGDKMLTLKRSQNVWHYRGAWGIVGGFLPDGIDPVQHAYTELREELGFARSDVHLERVGRTLRIHDRSSRRTWVTTPVLFSLRRNKVPKLDWEHTAYRWIRPEDFPYQQSYYGARKHLAALGLA
ncbi:MAG: alpha/beta fold hydrolase [Candidatus Kerfeldbacteria bacterium]|nr:alpha/beta fold hydrolase [Candidatus Kerfeldbacteria bacterium]